MDSPGDFAESRLKRKKILQKPVSPVFSKEPGGPGKETKITIFDYDESRVEEKSTQSVEECFAYKDKKSITWINIDSISDMEVLEKIGARFNIHPLILEDIANPSERAKFEDFDEYIYILLKMLRYKEAIGEVEQEQVSLILGPTFVITFQEEEKKGDVFDPLRDRIRASKGRIRRMGADYLAYSIVDAIVDNYFEILEHVGDRIETVEEEIVTSPTRSSIQNLHFLKREILFVHRAIWPLREVLSRLLREDTLISAPTRSFLDDVYEHTIQIIETIENFRDLLSSLLDIYLSTMSNRTNDIMKVLTIISTIFIPLTFIAGVYGMNFDFMPELKWKFGYYMVWAVNISIAVVLILFFHKKKWL